MEIDLRRLEQVILRELQYQGVGAATVELWRNEGRPITAAIWCSRGATAFCQPISDQLEGLDPANVRELDLEITELINAGLLERKDGGYALTDHHQ